MRPPRSDCLSPGIVPAQRPDVNESFMSVNTYVYKYSFGNIYAHDVYSTVHILLLTKVCTNEELKTKNSPWNNLFQLPSTKPIPSLLVTDRVRVRRLQQDFLHTYNSIRIVRHHELKNILLSYVLHQYSVHYKYTEVDRVPLFSLCGQFMAAFHWCWQCPCVMDSQTLSYGASKSWDVLEWCSPRAVVPWCDCVLLAT
jgi:hypothetical protein